MYALVRFFKPSNILEVGTYIGTTASVMSQELRKNREEDPSRELGHVYTVDMANEYLAQPRDVHDHVFCDIQADFVYQSIHIRLRR